MIRFKNLTKLYKNNRGILDLSFEIADGEVFGCLGPKGSGKSTIFAELMGFEAPTRGWCTINGKNCQDRQKDIQYVVGYLPQRPEFPREMTVMQFLRFQASVRGVRSMEKALMLADRLELNLEEKADSMTRSKKQRLGIVGALLHDPSVILLDEPTEGMDPRMRQRFIEVILDEKRQHKTILMAARGFDDMERVCDRLGMLKNGSLIHIDEIAAIRREKRKNYIITFETEQEAYRFVKEDVKIHSIYGNQVTVNVKGELKSLIRLLGDYEVVGLEGTAQSLEEIFVHFYGGDLGA